MTSMPHLPYSPNLAWSDSSFVSPMKKVLKGKCSASVEEVKQKTAEALKLTSLKTVLSSEENVLIGVYCIKWGEHFEGD